MNDNVKQSIYVRRGERTFGPYSIRQILRLKAENKLKHTDLLSGRQEGPWYQAADALKRLTKPTSPSAAMPVDPIPSNTEGEIVQATIVQPPVLLRTPQVVQATLINTPPPVLTMDSNSTRTGVGLRANSRVIWGAAIGLVTCLFLFRPSGKSVSSTEEDTILTASNSSHVSVAGSEASATNDSNESAAGKSDLTTSISEPDSEASVTPMDPKAMHTLARSYSRGEGVEKSDELAFIWMKRSAEAGCTEAMYELATYYAHGTGTAEDVPAFRFWLEKSARAGDSWGMYWYSEGIRMGQFEGTADDEEYWLNRSAEMGFDLAIKDLQNRQKERLMEIVGSAVVAGVMEGLSGGSSDGFRAGSTNDFMICDGSGIFFPCKCDGFEPGGRLPGNSNEFPSLVCVRCNHQKNCHSR